MKRKIIRTISTISTATLLTPVVLLNISCAVDDPEVRSMEQRQVAEWAPGVAYSVGDVIGYSGATYEVIAAHTSQTGWEPPQVPALFNAVPMTDAWTVQVPYAVGDEVTFQGLRYVCLQAHTALSGWEPPNTPALWEPTDPVGELWVWPMPGQDGIDWVINNYVDQEPGPGVLDYMGGSKGYDGHRAIDIDIPTFREMDGGYEAVAAAAGEVVSLWEGSDDRNTSCMGSANYVYIKTPAGLLMSYLHFAKNSITSRVQVGDQVEAGQPLGVVGSSGCSTQPHLHFEVFGTNGQQIDPFELGLWADPPVYDTPASVMDITIVDHVITPPELKDPPPNVSTFSVGDTISVAITAAGGDDKDIVGQILRPDGSLFSETARFLGDDYTHSYWFMDPDPGTPQIIDNFPGTWTVRVIQDGQVLIQRAIEVD